jgi:hypothetical protein
MNCSRAFQVRTIRLLSLLQDRMDLARARAAARHLAMEQGRLG